MLALPPTMTEIATAVAEKHGLTLEDLKGPDQRARVSRARQEAYAALWEKNNPTRSSVLVARFFNRTDHTTVIHGVKAHRARMAEGAGE